MSLNGNVNHYANINRFGVCVIEGSVIHSAGQRLYKYGIWPSEDDKLWLRDEHRFYWVVEATIWVFAEWRTRDWKCCKLMSEAPIFTGYTQNMIARRKCGLGNESVAKPKSDGLISTASLQNMIACGKRIRCWYYRAFLSTNLDQFRKWYDYRYKSHALDHLWGNALELHIVAF